MSGVYAAVLLGLRFRFHRRLGVDEEADIIAYRMIVLEGVLPDDVFFDHEAPGLLVAVGHKLRPPTLIPFDDADGFIPKLHEVEMPEQSTCLHGWVEDHPSIYPDLVLPGAIAEGDDILIHLPGHIRQGGR